MQVTSSNPSVLNTFTFGQMAQLNWGTKFPLYIRTILELAIVSDLKLMAKRYIAVLDFPM